MKNLLIFTSILESSLGILLILVPSIIIKLIFGIEANEPIETLSHLTGIVYFCFGLACFPFNEKNEINQLTGAVRGMFAYNFIVTLFFGYLKIQGSYDGVLLVPVLIAHGLITLYFVFRIMNLRKN